MMSSTRVHILIITDNATVMKHIFWTQKNDILKFLMEAYTL